MTRLTNIPYIHSTRVLKNLKQNAAAWDFSDQLFLLTEFLLHLNTILSYGTCKNAHVCMSDKQLTGTE